MSIYANNFNKILWQGFIWTYFYLPNKSWFFFFESEQNKVKESAVWRATKANVIQHQCKIFPHWKYEWNEEWKKAENEKIAE